MGSELNFTNCVGKYIFVRIYDNNGALELPHGCEEQEQLKISKFWIFAPHLGHIVLWYPPSYMMLQNIALYIYPWCARTQSSSYKALGLALLLLWEGWSITLLEWDDRSRVECEVQSAPKIDLPHRTSPNFVSIIEVGEAINY